MQWILVWGSHLPNWCWIIKAWLSLPSPSLLLASIITVTKALFSDAQPSLLSRKDTAFPPSSINLKQAKRLLCCLLKLKISSRGTCAFSSLRQTMEPWQYVTKQVLPMSPLLPKNKKNRYFWLKVDSIHY